MKRIAFLIAVILATIPLWSQCGNCVFYGGDFDSTNPSANGLANENDAIVGGSPYGAATYQNFFIVNVRGVCATVECYYYTANVAGLFTDNLSFLNPSSGYWEIRSGVSEGNGGTLIASGTGSMYQAPTGRSGFGYTEYRDEVGAHVSLPTGTYWFAVVPNDPTNANRSFNSNTFGLNSVGTQIPNEQYWNSAFFGANFTNANNDGVFPTFSSGVVGGCDCRLAGQTVPPVPEPSSLILLGTGLVGAAATARRRWFIQYFGRNL